MLRQVYELLLHIDLKFFRKKTIKKFAFSPKRYYICNVGISILIIWERKVH